VDLTRFHQSNTQGLKLLHVDDDDDNDAPKPSTCQGNGLQIDCIEK